MLQKRRRNPATKIRKGIAMKQVIADIKAYLLSLRLPRILGSWRMRAFFLVITAIVVVMGTLIVSFSHERSQREAEMALVMPETPHTPAEIRGLMNNMIRDRLRGNDTAPAFIPQSMWRDPVCAAAVIAMVNGLVGQLDYLRSTSAWTFQRDNPDRVRLLYDREQSGDYAVTNDAITETHDRTWWFSRLRRFLTVGQGSTRTSARIYVLGYRYKRTAANPKILEARRGEGADQVGLNSHLILLLGSMNGEWYGYHLFHDPDAPNASPFRIDALGSDYITTRFDMVRIWEVVGPELTLEEAPVAFRNPARPYTAVHSWLGHANRLGDRMGFFFNAATMGFVGDRRQFPYVEHIEMPRRVTTTIAPTPSRPTARPRQPRQPSHERQGKHRLAQVSRRNTPPPRVGAINQKERRVRHEQRTSHPRR